DFAFWHDIENILTEKGLVLTAEEKVMMEEARARIGRDEYLAFMKVSKTSAEAHRAFLQKYQQESGEYHRNERMNTRNQLLAEKLGISSGLIIDVMNAQDLLGNIVEELNPMEKEELLAASKSIQTPFIALYILDTNESTIKKIEELKASTGYVVHQVPKADSEQLFESMMEPFKGKVVFVDFWATWCGPCRSGMQQMKPLKESLKGQPIVFVYLTNETSPTGTWQNMVAEIGGEHFRLNKDEWNILSERFGVSGIPHYVLVDKTGKVAKNNGMSTWDSNGMKKLFEEFMAQ
ncbi:MAG: TlpA family protein disulfide reductase, partial [Prolixibacteraceae bacterium]|nr:TlpA family protein disulfide reductase [Prolixibacteraceae bacterium]